MRRKRRVLSVGMEGKGKGAVEDAEHTPKGVFDMFGIKGWGEKGVEHDNHALGVFDVFDVMGKRPNTTNMPWGRVCCIRREGWVRRGDVEAVGCGVGVGASRRKGRGRASNG